MSSVVASFSVLWHLGVALMGGLTEFFGLSIRLHAVLQLCRAVLNQLVEENPLNSSQVEDVKRIDKKLLIFPWFGRMNTNERSSVQYGCKQQDNLTTAQFNSTKFNQIEITSKGPSKSPITLEDHFTQCTEWNCSQHYLNKFNQDHFEHHECVAINHFSCHCMIPKHSISPSEWNKMMTNREDHNSTDSEEWEDSEEDSEIVCSSDDSLSDVSDQELNEMPWKSSFIADSDNPLNFTACLSSSSTKRKASLDLNTQGLLECESGRKSLIKVKFSTLQKPVLPQIHFRHYCIPETGEIIRFCTRKVSAKSVKGEDNKVEKPSVKKVRFSPFVEVHKMVTWSFASREARKGQWMQIALDRMRFLDRIQATEEAIGYCLQTNHRNKILERNSQLF
ncbi:uncharacterized protein [Chiloscyllium punctatum]|uniref:uncharacterized protein n=1 Tax=Chiloscyllium punctatum TaxID=137246 RepID=UPI003B641124